MMKGQLIPAFICALLAEGVEAEQIERAISRVRSTQLRESISSDNPLHRSFAFEQADLLERALIK